MKKLLITIITLCLISISLYAFAGETCNPYPECVIWPDWVPELLKRWFS